MLPSVGDADLAAGAPRRQVSGAVHHEDGHVGKRGSDRDAARAFPGQTVDEVRGRVHAAFGGAVDVAHRHAAGPDHLVRQVPGQRLPAHERVAHRAANGVEALRARHHAEQRRRGVDHVDAALAQEAIEGGAVAPRRLVHHHQCVAEQQRGKDLLHRGVESVGGEQRHAQRAGVAFVHVRL